MNVDHDETMLPGDDYCMRMRGIAVGYTTNAGFPLVFHGINSTGTIKVECVTGNNTVPGGSPFAEDPDYKVMGAVDDSDMSTVTIERFIHCGMLFAVTPMAAGVNGFWIHRSAGGAGSPNYFETTATATDYLGKMVGLTLDYDEGRIFILPWRI